MLINLTKQSLHLDNGVLLCKGQVLDFSTAEVTGIGDIMHRVMQLTAKFKELNLDDAEFVCIKVIVLLNPGKEMIVFCTFGLMFRTCSGCNVVLNMFQTS